MQWNFKFTQKRKPTSIDRRRNTVQRGETRPTNGDDNKPCKECLEQQ